MRRALAGGALASLALTAWNGAVPVASAPDAVRPAGAQTGGASPARIALAAIPPWIEVGAAVSIDLRIEPLVGDLEVVANVHPATTNRTAFGRSVEGDGLEAPLGTLTAPVDTLEAGPVGTHRLTIDLSAQPADPELPSIPVGDVGVYPLSIQLRVRGAEAPTDALVTHLVVLDEDAPPARLAVAWIWPIEVEGALEPDGRPGATMEEAVAPAGHLAQFTDALGNAPDLPVTLAPTPATVDAWTLLAAAGGDVSPDTTAGPEGGDPAELAARRLDTLREAAARPSRQVITGPYAPTDFTALVAADLEAEVARQLARGTDVLRAALGIRPDPRTFLASHLDAPTLEALRDAGVDRLVVEPALLEPVFSNLTLARPFEVRSGGRTFDTAIVDAALSELLLPPVETSSAAERPSSVAVAQRLLAGLATVALEAPGEERGVVVAAPATWNPSAGLLVTVLEGMRDHPALRPVTVDALFGRVDPAVGETATRTLSPTTPDGLRISPGRLRDARRRIDSLASMTGEDAPAVASADRLFLLTTAAGTRSTSEAIELLNGINALIDGVTAGVRLPSEPSVTLTAQRARIPISLVNETRGPLRVRVRLSSDRLLFPDGETHEIDLPPRTSTVQFTVEARTSGSFPMAVEVTSPDGHLRVGRFTMTVRSTAVSGVALALTVGAGVFLAGWWGNHFRKSRRARRASPGGAQGDGPAAPSGGGGS